MKFLIRFWPVVLILAAGGFNVFSAHRLHVAEMKLRAQTEKAESAAMDPEKASKVITAMMFYGYAAGQKNMPAEQFLDGAEVMLHDLINSTNIEMTFGVKTNITTETISRKRL
jgi:hypothetical protein